ncbi:hypothetical protein ACB092_05G077900 [Castanea dentata]
MTELVTSPKYFIITLTLSACLSFCLSFCLSQLNMSSHNNPKQLPVADPKSTLLSSEKPIMPKPTLLSPEKPVMAYFPGPPPPAPPASCTSNDTMPLCCNSCGKVLSDVD